MKQYSGFDLAKKFRVSQLVKIEDELKNLEIQVHLRKQILKIAEVRDESIKYWNNHTPEERANFGKSQEEINDKYAAKTRSPVDFTNVSEKSFDDLPELWRSLWLSGTVDFFSGSTTNTPKTQQEAEA